MDRLSKKILSLFRGRPSLTISQMAVILKMDPYGDLAECVLELKKDDILEIEPNYSVLHDVKNKPNLSVDTPFIYPRSGRAIARKENRSNRRLLFSEIRAWVTLAIALAALMVSIVR